MKNSETKDFVAYEYLSINVSSDKEPLYIDCYENFGWILINNIALVDEQDYYINNNANINSKKMVNIKFKRDRKIKNKVQLLALQRKLESSLKNIDKLEKEPSIKGTVPAMVLGVIGTIFLTISVFAITSTVPNIIVCILSGAVGLVGWTLPYFTYKNLKGKYEKENISLIDEEYNTIYDTCESAKKLLD